VALINHFLVGRYVPHFITGLQECKAHIDQMQSTKIDLDAIFLAPLREEPLYRGGLSYSLFLLLRFCIKDNTNKNARIDAKSISIVIVSAAIIFFILTIYAYIFDANHIETAVAAAITASLLGLRFMPRNKARYAVLATLTVIQSFLFARLHLSLYCTQTLSFWDETLLTLPQLLGGLMLSVIAWRFGLRGSILGHGLNNLISELLRVSKL